MEACLNEHRVSGVVRHHTNPGPVVFFKIRGHDRSLPLVLTTLALVGALAITCFGRNKSPSGAAAGGDPAWPSRTFRFEYDTRVPRLPAGAHGLRLWIPVPQSDPYQTISNVVIESPVPYSMHSEPEYGNQYAYLEFDADKVEGPVEVKMRFQVTRRERHADLSAYQSVSATKPMPDGLEMHRSLQPDHLVPIDGLIGHLSQEHTQGLADPLQKARAIYEYVVSTMKYDKTGQGWGRGDALFACDVKKGNCTDFHALFIGMARAAGIPARFQIGFPIPANQRSGEIPGYHCWALFYLNGTGWVPVDASEAWKNPQRHDYYFGNFDEDRVQFTEGRDIVLDPRQQGTPLNYFIYPYAELDGKPWTDVEHKFSFQDAEAN
jgi:transglutaminase-like putative cysteine protease